MSIKILLADDHKIIREGLCSLIDDEGDMVVVGEAGNGKEAVELARTLFPDVVVMDISMPELNGIEATRRILSKQPEIKIIALSMHSDKFYIAKIIKEGAKAYLLKDCAFDELVHAIRIVLSNQTFLSPKIDKADIEDYIEILTRSEGFEPYKLTSKEREVLQLLAEGNTLQEIGTKLSITAKTVETHRSRIMKKLEIKTMADLTKFAFREGIISLKILKKQ